MIPLPSFAEFFEATWKKPPFPWQQMLAERVANGHWPDAINLPTASGKTACLDVAVYALAAQADRPLGTRSAARRIWFAVDRRIVVDEAFERAEKLAGKLAERNAPGAIRAVAERLLALRGLPSKDRPLAIGRLRGGVLRDDRWARIPSQAAIITSTVDQLGSRLLFRSYGDSSLTAPVYAGLAGNDSLILLDEAHCAVPFLQTLRAVQLFRTSKWSEIENPTPFHVTILSATPPDEDEENSLDVFPAETECERALSHPKLQDRLRASKKAKLQKVKDEKALAKAMAETAASFARDGRCRVGVIVNRVGRAAEIAEKLSKKAREGKYDGEPPMFDVHLLTGRIRPIERDLLVGKDAPLHNMLRAFDPEPALRPLILVATQCLEVGADFSFDALVIECASLDAVRQRFGRLDRLGTFPNSPAAIFTADSLLKESDPIYGDSLKSTWEFLSEPPPNGIAVVKNAGTKGECRIVDFGVNALAPLLPEGDALRKLLAPAPDAPILLPAHVDLLCQTAPQPHPNPDLAPFLHGKGRGVSEIRVVWRCDLAALHPEDWPEAVSLCRPVTGEMLSVPLYRFREWLRNRNSVDRAGDVEGTDAEVDGEQSARSVGIHFLLWRGRDRSEVVTDPDKISAGSIVVLPPPENPNEAKSLGQVLREQGFGHDRLDLWELAWLSTGRPAMLRVNRDCLAPWLPTCPPLCALLDLIEPGEWFVDDLRDALAAVQGWMPEDESALPLPKWLQQLFAAVADVRSQDVTKYRAGGLILRAKAQRGDTSEHDFFADDEDGFSEAPESVSLASHTADVERNALLVAKACFGDSAHNLFAAAARWHDTGKLDARFQAMLNGGLPPAGEPLAKSPAKPRSREQAVAVMEASGLPGGFRHEMLSLQLAERFVADKLAPEERILFFHLIASHHGHARPFAPVCEDAEPPSLTGRLNGIDLQLTAKDRMALAPPHRLDSAVSERFWTLTRRFGWWGLAYREAILRLADWHASAHPHDNQEQS